MIGKWWKGEWLDDGRDSMGGFINRRFSRGFVPRILSAMGNFILKNWDKIIAIFISALGLYFLFKKM
jgi:hypothetical protein